MRQILLILLSFGFFSCDQHSNNNVSQNRIDSLESKLSQTYKPGFGEFMSSIQAHHSKLWFAGQNENWKLADFEVHEIMEIFEDIQKYQTGRKESQMISMINPAIDSVSNAIKRKNTTQFKSSYSLLTNICNDCHSATNFEFIVVKIPDSQPFSNQDFKINR